MHPIVRALLHALGLFLDLVGVAGGVFALGLALLALAFLGMALYGAHRPAAPGEEAHAHGE